MALILRYFTEYVYSVVFKTITRPTSVSKSTFDSLWPFQYDLHNYSTIIWAKQTLITRFDEIDVRRCIDD